MESNRVIDLDEMGDQPIKLAGIDYVIRQQRQAIIEKVLRFAHTDPDIEAAEIENQSFADLLFLNWDTALPSIALMLGCEQEAAQTECVKHLKDHLTIPAALRIWELWWEVNRIQDFFNRGGRALLPPYVLELAREEALTKAP